MTRLYLAASAALALGIGIPTLLYLGVRWHQGRTVYRCNVDGRKGRLVYREGRTRGVIGRA